MEGAPSQLAALAAAATNPSNQVTDAQTVEDYLLTKTQRNEVLEAIQVEGLEPIEFSWSTASSPGYYGGGGGAAPDVSLLTHEPTQSTFTFDFAPDTGHWAVFRPGVDKPCDHVNVERWGTQVAAVRQWLGVVHTEADAVDLWAAFEGAQSLAAPILSGESEMFDADDRAAVVHALSEIRKHFTATQELTEAQTDYLDARLGYLEDAVTRLRRTDWLHTAIGVFGTLLIALGIEAARGTQAWQFIEQALGPVLRGALPLP